MYNDLGKIKEEEMRFVHLADLHIGKRVNEFSMLEDQRYILEQVLRLLDSQIDDGRKIDGVLIAGDIYDKAVPPAEAVRLLDWFLTELVQRKLPVYMVSGNHDSGERLSFGAHLLEKSGVFLKTVYDGSLKPLVLEDEYGTLNLYLLPFVKPIHVRRAHKVMEESLIETHQEAISAVLQKAEIESCQRNLLVAHQMVTGAQRCDSEEISIGGLDNIDACVFDDFDYVALGHLHGPQKVGREEVRYGGTLLKYSFSERNHKKSVTFVELGEKGQVTIETVAVKPLRDMRQIEGTYQEVMAKDYCGEDSKKDYLKVILKDEEEIPEALYKLRTVYPNIMKLEYSNTRTRQNQELEQVEHLQERTPLEYIEEFYQAQNNQKMTESQRDVVKELVEKIWG
jgi:exonuclease SbcD